MSVAAVNKHERYTDEVQRVIRWVALLMPLLVLTYGIGIRAGFLESDVYYSDAAFTVICGLFTVMGVWQYFTPRLSVFWQAAGLTLYHIFVAAFLLFVAGFNTEVALLWVVLMMAADLYFGSKGYILSTLGLYATAITYVAQQPRLSETAVYDVMVTVLITTIAGYLVLRLRSLNEGERRALNHTRKQEELHRDRLTTLINSMGEAVVSTDTGGEIRLYNAALLNLVDTNESLAGKNIAEVLNLRDEKGNKIDTQQLLLLQKGPTTLTNLAHYYNDEERVSLSISMSPIRPGYLSNTQIGYILVMRDITKEKSLEEERDEFISVVSHELRTPVAIAEGNISNVQLLMKKGFEKKMLENALSGAHEQIMFLSKMINDLSALSRAERGADDTKEDIEVGALLNSLYEEYHSQIAEKGLMMNLDIHGKIGAVHVSRLYLEEVLQNFITNAIKYTKEGSITLGASGTAENTVRFSVKDTGIGISKSDQNKVFDKFFRSEDYRTRETNGTGLGLYVVNKLAKKLKTAVEINSRLNYGSEFSFTLPLIQPASKDS